VYVHLRGDIHDSDDLSSVKNWEPWQQSKHCV